MRREMGPRSMSLPRGTSLHSSLCPSRVQPVSGVLGLTTPPTPPSTSATSSSGENLDQDELVSCTKGTLTGLQLLVKKDLTFTEKRSVQRNCGCVEITHHCKQTKRKKFHPFRAVRKIFRWGSKVKRVKCSEGVSSEGGGIVTSKKSLSVGELRQAALGDPLDPNMDLDDHSIDINDPTGLAVGSGAGCGVAAGAGPGAGLYSMAGLSLSHDSVFSPDTSTPAEMGQIIHPVPVMTGISITNSLFKNELFNRVRARQAGEEDSDEEEDEDPGLPRSPCSHTPPNAGEHASEGGLLLPCGGVIGSDGRVPGTLGTHAGQHPLTGSIASILQHSSPGNKAKARSTCSAGSLSSMLSSETDEDSLSAGASNSQHSSVGVSGGGQSSGSAVGGGGVDKGGQMSHNAARHKIAIKPKKNHGRRRPVRATPTEPSLPATPEERTTPSTADDEAAIPAYNNQSLSNSNSTAELLDIETSGGSASAVSSRPMSTDEEVATTISPLANLSATPVSQKSSPLPECSGNMLVAGLPQSANADNSSGGHGSLSRLVSSQQQSQQEKRRSAAALLDETPEPVIVTPTHQGQTLMQSGLGVQMSDQADLLRQSDVSPKRRPTGGVAMISVQSIQGALNNTSRSLGSPVQRSKSMKVESADGFRAGQCQNELSPGGRPRGLRPVSQISGDLRPDLDVDTRDNKVPLSAQNSPVKRGFNVSSDFFQRSKSFSAKVSETHQTLEGPNGKELNNPIQIDEVVVADVRESIKSLERRKQCSPTGLNSIQSGVPSTIITQGPSVLVAGTMPAVVNVAGRMSPAYFLHQQQQQQQQQQHHNQHQHYSSVTTSMVSATSNDPAVDHQGSRADAPTSPPATSPCQTSMPPNPFVQARIYKGARRREIDDEKDDKVTLAGNGAGQSSAFAGSGAKMGLAGTAGVAERPRSELLEGVELRRPRSVQTRLSPDDACGSAQPNLQQQQTTTSSFAGEPELFKVFARRSLKQKPGPHVEKQDTEMETEKLVARQQENNDKDQAREGKVAGNNNTNKSTIPQVRSVTDAKRISEPSAGQGIDHSAPAGLLSGPNLTSVELLPSKKELNKLKIGANVISSKDKNKESLVASNQETGGSVLELRREADQFRRQQSLAQPPMSHQPEPISPGGRVGQGSSRSLHMSAPIGQTGGSQHQTGETKRISAVLLQRASSVAVRGTEENAQENEQARTGTGTQGSDQPEWLQLAQKKREKRELQEKMDNTSMGVSNAAKVQDSASNNRLSSSNNFVNSQEASSAKPSAGLRSSKVLDLVSNFQKLQMA
ncbi:uncharacterized protein LOC111260931 isoform X2 [Varroa jacobsoni]|uniref:uncharacterized protein LOC111260931 isoform X2 n=1 Tax=Varroa jacobsoni TaxID=62625 RepID=UPI000BF2A076|nr:uncharacterized protein LOC111260931 isoform X2 [Varroa jacobsoni]